MKKEYEGLNFRALFSNAWEILSYSILDNGQEGYFLLRQASTSRMALSKKMAMMNAQRSGHLITEHRYWTLGSEMVFSESMFNDVFGILKSPDPDSDGLGQILYQFTVGGGNP